MIIVLCAQNDLHALETIVTDMKMMSTEEPKSGIGQTTVSYNVR